MELSIVIPVRNEAGSIEQLAREIGAALDPTGLSWEALWIDDASEDDSLRTLQRLRARDHRHRWAGLGRHQGQSTALAEGFRLARGDRIVTLDGDLQNDPADIPKLLAFSRTTGLDVVNGVRTRRRDGPVRRTSSRIANRFRNALTGESVTDVGCSLRVFPARAARRLPPFRGMHRFLPTLLRLQGCSVGEIPVGHRPRVHGRTNYGVHDRLWTGIVDTLGVRWLKKRWQEPVRRGAGAGGGVRVAFRATGRLAARGSG